MKKKFSSIFILSLFTLCISVISCGKKKYTVVFISGGEIYGEPMQIKSGKSIEKPDDPIESDKNLQFDCWCTDSTFSDEYDFSAPITGNLTLYAKFIECPLYFIALENSAITLRKKNDMSESLHPPRIKLEYSFDLKDWDNYDFGPDFVMGSEQTINLNAGQKLYLRATDGGNERISESTLWHQFEITGKVEAWGNIMSLLDKSLKKNHVPDYCFLSLFRLCESLVSAPRLPATNVGNGCYCNMFLGTSISKAPQLPAIVLAEKCYSGMFYDCSHLTSIDLPAIILAGNCYYQMLTGAKKLAEVKVGFTNWSDGTTVNWLKKAGTDPSVSNKIFRCPEGLNIETRNDDYLPEGWNIEYF